MSSPSSRKVSSTVFWHNPFKSRRVESALGSHPTTMTFLPASASAPTVFCVVVDLPIPPFPYIAICLIQSHSFFTLCPLQLLKLTSTVCYNDNWVCLIRP